MATSSNHITAISSSTNEEKETPKKKNLHPKLKSVSQGLPEEENCCVVCSEPLVYCTLMDCGHRTCCSLCATRLRLLHNDEKCVLCKQVPTKVFVLHKSDNVRSHADIVGQNTWGERINGFILDDATYFYFANNVSSHLTDLQALRQAKCDKCPADSSLVFHNVIELQRHLDFAHQLYLCPLCLEHGGLFLRELPCLTRKQLAQHSRSGEARSAFTGHPTCQFCSHKGFYNDDHLYKHLKENHESCFLCTRAGARFQYFANYASLQTHFGLEHFLCPEPQCLAKRFCVFPSELELHAHFASEHPGRLDHRNIALDFVIRGSHRDSNRLDEISTSMITTMSQPTALSPSEFPALGNNRNVLRGPSWTSRSSNRGRMLIQSTDEFPTIGTAVPQRMDSRSFRQGEVRRDNSLLEDNFPSLPNNSSARKVSAIDRFEQWHVANRQLSSRDESRGMRQDGELLRVVGKAAEGKQRHEEEEYVKPKKGGKKPGGKNGKTNMYKDLLA